MVVDIARATTRVDSEDEWSRSGLNIVDSTLARRVVAFSADEQLETFRTRLARYGQGAPAGAKSAYQEGFFDSIVAIRPFGPTDRPGPRLQQLLATASGPETEILVDVELWYPGDPETASQWQAEIAEGLREAGGTVVDTYLSAQAGVSLLRARADIDVVRDLLLVDYVAEVELLPIPVPRWETSSQLTADELGDIPTAPDDAPVVGLIDSGVIADHPLLAGSVLDVTGLAEPGSVGVDEHGHGTEVASLLVHGSLDGGLTTGDWPTPICSVLSIRILDADLSLPSDALAERELEGALRYLARNGVKVVNLSLGDSDAVFAGGRAPRLASVLDSLARELGLVLVVPSGRIIPAQYYFPFDEHITDRYPARLLDDPESGLLDPAPAALALTVGSTVPRFPALPLDLLPLGRPGWPSPFGRKGPGIGGSIKPELVAPGGTLGQVRGGTDLVADEALAIRVADGRPGAAGVVRSDVGGSLAAPLVARVVSAAERGVPAASANLLRALTLQSANDLASTRFPGEEGMSTGAREKRVRKLYGYGAPRADRASSSAVREVVLFAEDVITVDDVHLYAVPIPAAFFAPGIRDRGVAVALAYDPPVRARRLDYLASRMQFELIRGLPAQQVLDLFLADQSLDQEGDVAPDARSPLQTSLAFEKISDLPTRHRIPLVPSRTQRSAGTNQVGSHVWRRAMADPDGLGRELLLVVQNVNRWDHVAAQQNYAVTLRFWVDDSLPEVYNEVRLRVDEVRTRARAQIRLGP